jgi:hypothetical protein
MSQIELKALRQLLLPRQGLEERIEYAISTLCGYVFLERPGESDIFDVHSLLHAVTRIWN